VDIAAREVAIDFCQAYLALAELPALLYVPVGTE
jgi:hypothetical protein